MNDDMTSDEVTDAIAHIEMNRQETVKESGLAHACSESLRKLNELLEQERAVAQTTNPPGGNLVNIEAINREIRKVKSLAGNGGNDSPRPPRHSQQPPQQNSAQPSPGGRGGPRNQGHGQGQGQGHGQGHGQGQPRKKGRKPAGRTPPR